jgi:RHS repeat-associated protein
VVRYTYADDNTLQAVMNPDGSLTTYVRDGVDQVTRQQNGNSTLTLNQFDAANRLLSTATSQISGNKLISSAGYQYNSVDQRTQATLGYRTGQPKTLVETYAYDALRRLVGQTDSAGVTTKYRFDAAGNRLAWQSSDNPATPRPNDALDLAYAYDAADALVRIDDLAGKTATLYRYDANGNRVERLAGREGAAYRYDAEQRLLSVQAFTVNGGGKRIEHEIATMLYDGDGRRVAKAEDHKVGGGGIQTTTYAYDGLDQIAVNETWHPQHQNLYRAEGGRILTLDGFAGGSDGQDYWFAQDGLGSTQALSKSDGQAAHGYQYDAYGQLKPENSGNFGPHNAFTFTGQEYDEFIGLYHYHARAYDAATGTWLTRDPYRGAQDDPQSLHRYGYVKGNPVNLIDIYGYAACGTYGKCFKQLEDTPLSRLFMTLLKKTINRDPSIDLPLGENTSVNVNAKNLYDLWKGLQTKTLFHDDLTPATLKHIRALKWSIDIRAEAEWSLGFTTKLSLDDPGGPTVSACIEASVRGEAGVTVPLNAFVKLDISGELGGSAEGCLNYNQQKGFDLSFDYTVYGSLQGKVYAELANGLAGARVGARIKATLTKESSNKESPFLDLEGAPFYGWKFWGGDWHEADLFTFKHHMSLARQ